MKKLIRHTAISSLLVIVALLAFASKGGGDKKKNASEFKDDFTPINAAGGFTLKSGYTYNGTFAVEQERTNSALIIHSMVAYQKGNTTLILPYKSRINFANFNNSGRSSLQLLGVKIKVLK